MVTLRNIFLELGQIFHFEYDKNPNGSYRVNTVIKNLVYPDLYLGQDFNSNDICYYLANLDFSYQGYPNIRNSFSELMNPKETGNRYPIIDFCNLIDVNKMYGYYEKLISDIKSSDLETAKCLSHFMNEIFDKYPAFHARLKLSCSKTHEFLTWIIIFSMFNSELSDTKYDQFLKTTNEDIPELVISESGERHRMSSRLITMKHRLDVLRNIIFTLSAIQIFLAFLPFIIPDEHKFHGLLTSSTFCIGLLGLSLIILILRTRQTTQESTYSNLQTYHDFMDELPDEEIQTQIEGDCEHISNQPFDNTAKSNVSRNKLRSTLIFILYLMLFASVFISFAANSFPLLITCVSVTIITIMYIDRVYHDFIIRSHYDSLSCADSKPKQWRGLARIYQWEYEKTGFNIKDDYYKTIVHVHSSTCYKHIFLLAHEQFKYKLFIYTTVLIYFSAILLILETLIIIFGETITNYLRIPDAASLNIIITIYLVAIGIYTITTLITARTSYNYLSQLAYASRHAEDNPKWAEKLFLSLYSRGIIRDIDWIRGVFTHNVALFEKGHQAENIFPESDRMQFYHRHIALRPVASITIVLSYVAAVALFVWHMGMKFLLLPITAFCILFYVFLHYYGLNMLGKRRIIKEISHLRNETSHFDFT